MRVYINKDKVYYPEKQSIKLSQLEGLTYVVNQSESILCWVAYSGETLQLEKCSAEFHRLLTDYITSNGRTL